MQRPRTTTEKKRLHLTTTGCGSEASSWLLSSVSLASPFCSVATAGASSTRTREGGQEATLSRCSTTKVVPATARQQPKHTDFSNVRPTEAAEQQQQRDLKDQAQAFAVI